MTLHRLEVFLTVANRLSVTRASLELRVSQPAISQEIKRLEQSLGVKLIRRSGRGIELTEVGVSMRNDVKKILSAIQALKSKYRVMVLSLGYALIQIGEVCEWLDLFS